MKFNNSNPPPHKPSWWGRLIRLPLKLIPDSQVVPILRGPLKGKKWIAGSCLHGCWLGTFESKKAARFKEVLKPKQIVFDIGAHAGYYALLASMAVGPEGKVYAFEPLPQNLANLQEHLRLNQARNVVVREEAASNATGTASFKEGPTNSEGYLWANGDRQVKTVKLDELVDSGEIPLPHCMKIDIEGGEFQALLGTRKILERAHPAIFLALDDLDLKESCFKLLLSLGYALEPLNAKNLETASEILAQFRFQA